MRPADPQRPDRSRGFVDYERVAARYQLARSLPVEVLEKWGAAVRPYLPREPCRVVDLGAGTGLFASVWHRWTTATVVAVEPSAAMTRVGRRAAPSVNFVRGTAERLPLRDSLADIVWMSTSLHHFADMSQAAAETARVLDHGGRALVRTYAPGRTRVTWLDEFPGRARWESRFPTEEQLRSIFRPEDFTLADVQDVVEWTETYDTYAVWVASMKQANSMLTALTDEEIAEGLAALRSTPTKIGHTELTLFVFTRR